MKGNKVEELCATVGESVGWRSECKRKWSGAYNRLNSLWLRKGLYTSAFLI
jgi:hypothetical protein